VGQNWSGKLKPLTFYSPVILCNIQDLVNSEFVAIWKNVYAIFGKETDAPTHPINSKSKKIAKFYATRPVPILYYQRRKAPTTGKNSHLPIGLNYESKNLSSSSSANSCSSNNGDASNKAALDYSKSTISETPPHAVTDLDSNCEEVDIKDVTYDGFYNESMKAEVDEDFDDSGNGGVDEEFDDAYHYNDYEAMS